MKYNRTYTFNRDKSNGHQPCDILMQHYDDDKWKTVVMREDDLIPWKICEALNNAYETGKKDALRDVRLMLGINDQ